MKHFRRRKPNRLKGFDYSSPNQYFVTINTKNKVEHFGLIKDKEMVLNEFGQIAFQQWKWLEERYPYVKLHAFVVMPDHFHGIIQITNYGSKKIDNLDLNKNENGTSEKPIKIKSISELIGAFKTTSSKQIHLIGNKKFIWQRSFHDSIIRSYLAFFAISKYIKNNPRNWKKSK
ncbi:MAG: hypothetical protein Q8R57_05965 [Bacteroidota bacterium]|nr:hypothetical protein [Bacteroidota bacterium]